ncbi:S1C family serine protease [Humibacter sp.]|uniref:S1C family serine protease n=1 Tax=Humibacter sp. TaxID=1940291 RepID=UPI003F81108B
MHRIDLNGTKIMRNDTSKRRTAGWITAAVAASVAFGLAGVTASVATVDSVAAAFSKTAIAHNSERAGYGWSYGGGQGSSGQGSSGSSSSSSAQAATASEEKGVVVIDTNLAYEGAQAAGTGIVLTSSGEILTNNHVVEGSTSITVTVPATGTSYKASVVGTDATDDVAVLQLSGASGLATATLDNDGVSVGDNVTVVGNAGGTGTLVAADGSVTGTGKSITTQSEGVVASESLTGLIETNADIQAGDSGGPLYDSQGEVVGIDTAASASQNVSDGYAIPIETALGIAHRIESGQASSTVTIGLPAFLGVEVASDASSSGYSGLGGASLGYNNGQSATQGAVVGGVIDGTPAASAGLTAGDTITAVDGTAIASSSDLTSALAQYKPGDSVTITWVDSAGASHSASVTLTSGPAA